MIDSGSVAQLGISAAISSPYYMRTAEESGVHVRKPYDIRHGRVAQH